MNHSRLRVYFGPDDDVHDTPLTSPGVSPNTVTVPAGEIFSLLMEAARSNRTWINDFQDDAVTISTDLYEVLLAYEHFRRPSA